VNLSGVELPMTDDSPKYESSTCKGKVVGFIDSEGYKSEGNITGGDERIGLVLDKSCFYAEAGGQVGDCGLITSNNDEFVVESTGKIAECIIHWGCLAEGSLSVGEQVEAKVDKNRESSKKNHTATHLLQWALQQVLGKTVRQQGSLVCPEYL
jgi:alanyl-tRNA synthetase